MALCIRFKTCTPASEHDDVGRTGVGGVLTASALRAESNGAFTAGTCARFGGVACKVWSTVLFIEVFTGLSFPLGAIPSQTASTLLRRAMQLHGNGMAMAGQWHGNGMAMAWQWHGKGMGVAWQAHVNVMAVA